MVAVFLKNDQECIIRPERIRNPQLIRILLWLCHGE